MYGLDPYGISPYGIGGVGGGSPSPPTVIPVIFPSTGSMLGGDNFIIINSGLSAKPFQDTFPGVTLNAVKWTNISSAGGTATVNNGLALNVSTAGGVAGIVTNSPYNNFDITTTLSFNSLIEQLFPLVSFTFCHMRAKIDTNNYFSVEFVWDPTRGPTIRAVVTQGGVATILSAITSVSSSTSLRLVRFGGRILAYTGTTLLVDYNGWRNDPVNIEIACKSPGTALPLSTIVSSYLPAMLITFGSSISLNGSESGNRVLGTTPGYVLPEGVEAKIHSPTTTITLGTNSFTYAAPLQLTISSSGTSTIFINNDNTLRDTSSTQSGLRV